VQHASGRQTRTLRHVPVRDTEFAKSAARRPMGTSRCERSDFTTSTSPR
jgi:hypothetical protein